MFLLRERFTARRAVVRSCRCRCGRGGARRGAAGAGRQWRVRAEQELHPHLGGHGGEQRMTFQAPHPENAVGSWRGRRTLGGDNSRSSPGFADSVQELGAFTCSRETLVRYLRWYAAWAVRDCAHGTYNVHICTYTPT